MKRKKICFTGGGTAGHVFPGISVINELCEDDGIDSGDFLWIGSNSGMEKRLVEARGIRFKGIASGKLRRYFSLRNLTDIFKITAGFFQAFFLLLKERPGIIFSKGGYVSVPPVIAGHILGIPVITHESDYTPGLATKINSMFADRILLSVDETLKYIKPKYRDKAVVTGNPIRKEFFHGDRAKGLAFLGLDEKKPVILIIGGSQGSGELNSLIYELRHKLTEKYYVVHQTGAGSAGIDGDPIGKSDVAGYIQLPFIKEEIYHVIAAASLVITRAGAGSLWELSAEKKAALLIPLRGSGTRGDQVLNANYFRAQDAASVLDDKIITADQLYEAIEDIFTSGKLEKFSSNIGKMAKPDSAKKIKEIICQFLTR